ncbi:MAG: ROK family protein [Bacteroidales bacterium]|jgi:glucokinase
MVIGVDLGGTNIRSGLVNDGKVVVVRHTVLTNKDSLSKTISQLTDTIQMLISHEVTGIGIGVPSVVDIENGIVYNVVNIPSWEKVELKSILEDRFHIPVSVNNDVNCFVLGEHLYGQAKGCSSVVGLTLGTGLGAGIIVNNHLFEGQNCGAGEIGMLPYLDQNFEFYTSSSFFHDKYHISASRAHYEALQKKQEAFEIWKEYGIHVGNVLKAVVYTYDPEMIIIGGSIAKAHQFFFDSMMDELAGCYYKESIKKVKICFSDEENMAILGAASLVKTGKDIQMDRVI